MAAAYKGNKSRVRSLRFATSHDAERSQSHVHFDEKLHASVVMGTQESGSSFLVKVGLLRILHRYEITFTPPPGHRPSKDVRDAAVPSLHLQLLGVMPTPEEMLLACEGGADTCVRVPARARATDGHRGSSLMPDGVKCLDAELG
ncbi:hypothetical protein FD754_015377 [Muntiacus muntjak]|uniref:Adipose-secreted signaling protein n=1 Tax=Muntiacus muntjak TaxID=9888 RepID=A0A5N3VMF8_MUNMU|nr:hypothetical protein FD754_015377 [Muntiacus muntjak]